MERKIKIKYREFVEKARLKKRNVPKKHIITAIVVLIFLFLLIFFIFNRDNLSTGSFFDKFEDKLMSFGVGGGFPYDTSSEDIIEGSLCLISGNIAVLTQSTFESLNLSGKTISSRKHNFGNPAMKSSSSRAVLYDSQGYKYRVETCSRTIIEGESEDKILNCAVSKEGSFGLVTQSKNYLSQITVFDKKGKEKYKYYFAECYILDMDIRDDGGGAAVCGFYSQDAVIKSFIYIFDFSKGEPQAYYEYKDNLGFVIKYLTHKDVAVIADKGIKLVNTFGSKDKEISYNDKVLRCSDFCEKSGKIIYCLSGSQYDKESEVIMIDKDGNIVFDLSVPHGFGDIKYNFSSNCIYGVENGRMLAYNTSGALKYKLDLGPFSNKVLPYYSSVYFVDSSRVHRSYLE